MLHFKQFSVEHLIQVPDIVVEFKKNPMLHCLHVNTDAGEEEEL